MSPAPNQTSAQIHTEGADRKKLRRAAQGSVINLIGAGTTAVASFGLTIVVTRALSASQAGVFFSATSLFVLVVAVSNLGTKSGLVRFIAAATERQQPEVIRSYIRAAFWPVILTSLIFSSALFILSPQIAPFLSHVHEHAAGVALRALSWFIPFAAVEKLFLSATRGLGSMRPDALVEHFVRPGLQLAVATGIVLASFDNHLIWAWGLPYAVAAAIAWAWWRTMSKAHATVHVPSRVGGHLWRFSIPRLLTDLAQTAMQRLDIVLVGALAGAPSAAVYAAATRFIVLGQMGRKASARAIQPQLAAALSTGSFVEANRLYQISTAWLIMVSWPIYLILLLDAPTLLTVFGHNYHSGALPLIILAAAMLVSTFCGHVDAMLVMSGRPGRSLFNTIFAVVANIGLDLWLIPHLGIAGAAIGWAAAIVSKNVLATAQVYRIFRVQPFGHLTARVACIATLSFVGLELALRSVTGSGALATAIGAVVGAVLYALLLWRKRYALNLDIFLPRRRSTPHDASTGK